MHVPIGATTVFVVLAAFSNALPVDHLSEETSPNPALANPFESNTINTSLAGEKYKLIIGGHALALSTYKSALKDSNDLMDNYKPSTTSDEKKKKRVDPKPAPMPPPTKPTTAPTNTPSNPPKAGYGQNHNYAMVCLLSREHTTYCQNLPRGYYCSGNGYLVQRQEATARYEPCESSCECINIGIQPPCFIRKADMSCQF